jgi:nucleoside phosphorylase
MEGYGVAVAATSHKNTEFLEIRGICDFGDENKNDDWHLYAADVAATYAIGLLSSLIAAWAAQEQLGQPNAALE